MKLFAHGHATHPDWRMAVALAAAQIDAQRSSPAGTYIHQPTLGWVYLTDHYAPQAKALLADLQQRWPGVAWVGAVGVGVAASGVEYFDEPALTLMLCDLPREQFNLFSGARPLSLAPTGFVAHTAQVHADGRTLGVRGLITELSERTASGCLFGGLASARALHLHLADGVFEGGMSGVAFGPQVALVSRVTQGCQPIGPVRRVTGSERNLVTLLDGEPALECLLRDLKVSSREPREALPRIRETMAGLSESGVDILARSGEFGADTSVRHLVGIDPARSGVALSGAVLAGTQIAFCQRNIEAARRDLVRICSEIREEVESETPPAETSAQPARQIAGAIYVSCVGRGGSHFGAPSAELAIVRRALGDVPLAGFFATGEIARRQLYGYTGVLTVFPA